MVTLAAGQNLVPNPSFEEHSGCPDGYTQLDKANDWTIRLNTPDFYHSCGANNFSTPNTGWGIQCPSTGYGFAAIHPYVEINPSPQEFFGAQLVEPLVIGQKYYVTFNVVMPKYSGCAINNFGVKFTSVFYGDTGIVPAPVVNNFAHVYSTDIIQDSTSWTTVFGSFIADSAYQYIMVGNFFDMSNTDTVKFSILNCTNVYYFIDDICVSTDSLTCVDITNDIIDFIADSTTIQNGSCVNYYVNTIVDYDFYEWQFPGGTPSFSTDSLPIICYDSTGSFDVLLITSDSSGCSDTIIKDNYITVNQANAIVKLAKKTQTSFIISPNPFSNYATLTFENVKKEKHALTLFDNQGRHLWTVTNITTEQVEIGRENLMNGLYFLQLQTDKRIVASGKLIIEQ